MSVVSNHLKGVVVVPCISDLIKYSEAESKRFNAIVYRGHLNTVSVCELIDFVNSNKVDFVMFRIKSDKLNELVKLNQAPFPYLVADTLLYYSCDLTQPGKNELKNKDIVFQKADLSDENLLNGMVEKIFDGYTNHYFVNPFLDKASILEGYKEWATNFLIEKNSKIVFIAKKHREVIAFMTCSLDEKVGKCEIVLNGVLPQFSGVGVYTDLLRFTKNYFQERNFRTIRVSTQSHNYAVQKAWVKESFYVTDAYNTVHINCLFNKTIIPKDSFTIEFSESDIERCIDFSGDDNLLHSSDCFARQKGFESRIAHGILLNSAISKHFGTINPGAGTIFLNYCYYFYQPIYLNRKYSVEISYPDYDRVKSCYLALVKVHDDNNEICAISYNNLLKK